MHVWAHERRRLIEYAIGNIANIVADSIGVHDPLELDNFRSRATDFVADSESREVVTFSFDGDSEERHYRVQGSDGPGPEASAPGGGDGSPGADPGVAGGAARVARAHLEAMAGWRCPSPASAPRPRWVASVEVEQALGLAGVGPGVEHGPGPGSRGSRGAGGAARGATVGVRGEAGRRRGTLPSRECGERRPCAQRPRGCRPSRPDGVRPGEAVGPSPFFSVKLVSGRGTSPGVPLLGD